MKYILLLSIMFTHTFAYSSPLNHNIVVQTNNEQMYQQSQDYVINVLDKEIGYDQTCLDEYIQRETHLKKWLIWTPPLAVVGVPTSGFVGLMGSAYLSEFLGATGWDVLGWAIAGGFLAFSGTVIASVGIETSSAIKFVNNRKMLYLVVESHQDSDLSRSDEKSKYLHKFYNKYKKAWPNDTAVTIDVFKQAVKDYDEKGMLCDGSLRQTDDTYKLKYKIARKWDLFNQIHKDYGAL